MMMPALNEHDRQKAEELLVELRARLSQMAEGDASRCARLAAYLADQLAYTPEAEALRRERLIEEKHTQQRGLCANCEEDLPVQGAELHRMRAADGDTPENTSLLCPHCAATAAALAKL